MGRADQNGGKQRGRRGAEHHGGAAPGRRDVVLAKKRAKVDLLDRLGETPGGGEQLAAMRLLAEVDLALSEHRRR
jgi:hypothetical protein